MKKSLRVIFTHIFFAIAVYFPLTTHCLYASFSKKDAGTSACQFLKIGAGARASGMGEAFVGVSDDASCLYWNPAGLGHIDARSLMVTHALWFEGINYSLGSYVHPVNNGSVGVGVQYLGYGELTGMDETGLETGSYNPRDIAVTAGYGFSVGDFLIGANVKYISSKITETGTAFGMDLGIQYILTDLPLTLGAVIQNVGSRIKYIEDSFDLPLTVKAGLGCRPAKDLIIAVDVVAPRDNEINIGAGAEYRYLINKQTSIAGRIGYNSRNREVGGLRGLTCGAGLGYDGYTVDYCFEPFGDLGSTHRVSFGAKW